MEQYLKKISQRTNDLQKDKKTLLLQALYEQYYWLKSKVLCILSCE